ncbi:MAG: hypothetical protein CVV24_14800 [Ignavibacteriae bacterium HGW-Ignavibacteriae-3]|nr:MAG: hypothetical protein CVV24_14800 [Ignavibacteriae bacterium HGW-Ignavibacteriae-3]
MNISLRSRIINDLQEDRAYKQNKYDGSGLKIYNRLILKKENKIRIGLLTEKDAGEKSINDFTTFHFYARDLGVVKSILAGDYLIEFGQGLALWSRYSISKGTETVRILPRNGKGIIPYLSSDENLFLRGAALQLSFSDLNLYSFISSKRLDGTINTLTNEISAIRIDGFHRNQNEINHQKIISEKIFGLSAEYNIGENASFGLLYCISLYGNNFQNNAILDPSGNRFNYFSASYNYSFNKLTFSGESSLNSGSIATINSAELAVDKNFTLLFSYRNYPKEYWGLHSNGFGEKDGAQNERGFYSGIKMKTELGTFYFYYDQFVYPYTSEKIPFASNGNEFLFYYTVRPLPNTEFRFRYIYQNKDNTAVIDDQYGLIKKRTENIRFELTYKASKNIQMRSRVNLSMVNAPSEKGILLFQEIKYLFLQTLNLSARVIFFKTDSYNSRIYEFENDLRGVMTNPPLYGEGMRWYIVSQYRTSFGLNLSMKYSELFKPGERTLSSGDTEIQGNLDNRLSFQVDWQF